MRDVTLYMSMSLDGFVGSDRDHPGVAIPEGAELAAVARRVRGPNEQPPEGRVLPDAQRRRGDLAGHHDRERYRLLIQPLVLGQGRALFDRLPHSRRMNLVEALSFPSGIVVHIHRPQHN